MWLEASRSDQPVSVFVVLVVFFSCTHSAFRLAGLRSFGWARA